MRAAVLVLSAWCHPSSTAVAPRREGIHNLGATRFHSRPIQENDNLQDECRLQGAVPGKCLSHEPGQV